MDDFHIFSVNVESQHSEFNYIAWAPHLPLRGNAPAANCDRALESWAVHSAGAEEQHEAAGGVGVVVEAPVAGTNRSTSRAKVHAGSNQGGLTCGMGFRFV